MAWSWRSCKFKDGSAKGVKSRKAVDQSFWKDGGAEGVRTPDLLNAIQALYQLSYDPNRSGTQGKILI